MSGAHDFCLRWSSYSQQLSEALRTLLDRELLVDVTLACDGRSLRAHRAVLSACSSYFQDLFLESSHPHPIVILKDVRYHELEALVKFMYHGEVTVNHDSLPGLLRTAETLHVRGLTDSALPGDTSSANSYKVLNATQRGNEGLGAVTTQDERQNSSQRLSPVQMKRIKLEQPTVSHYHQYSSRLPSHQQEIDHLNGNTLRDSRSVIGQDLQSTIGSEEASNMNQDQYHVQRTMSSLEGLSQLVMPILHDGNSNSPNFVGQSTTNQHQGLPTHQQHQAHHSTTAASGTSGSSRPFRQRVLYNQEQLLQLEAWYRQDRYPSGSLMREYADALAAMAPNAPGSLGAQPMRQNVDYWFQNRRRKDSHPEVMQQREKKKLAKSLWGNYNENNANLTNNVSPVTNAQPDSDDSNTNR